jgi:hypothetical protein
MGNKTKISGAIEMSKTHGGKGSKPRPIDRKAWDNSKLWGNLKKDKNKIIFIDERDDIPQEVLEQIVMKRGKANE